MARIKIDLVSWESAPNPICTKDVDLKNAEMALYNAMRMIWGYDNESIKNFSKGIGHERDVNLFKERLCQEEEQCILEWGGVYYEEEDDDMTNLNREFNKVYDSISEAYDLLNKFYMKLYFNENENNNLKELFTKMGEVKEIAHEVAEHYTWD